MRHYLQELAMSSLTRRRESEDKDENVWENCMAGNGSGRDSKRCYTSAEFTSKVSVAGTKKPLKQCFKGSYMISILIQLCQCFPNPGQPGLDIFHTVCKRQPDTCRFAERGSGNCRYMCRIQQIHA